MGDNCSNADSIVTSNSQLFYEESKRKRGIAGFLQAILSEPTEGIIPFGGPIGFGGSTESGVGPEGQRRPRSEEERLMYFLVQYAMMMQGIPYKWGGATPAEGLDCSGYIQVVLDFAGIDPPGDQTAQGLYDHLSKRPGTSLSPHIKAGVILFFGKDSRKITHVAFAIDQWRMMHASGGGSKTKTKADAIKHKAFVKGNLITSRKDLVAWLRPEYACIGCF